MCQLCVAGGACGRSSGLSAPSSDTIASSLRGFSLPALADVGGAGEAHPVAVGAGEAAQAEEDEEEKVDVQDDDDDEMRMMMVDEEELALDGRFVPVVCCGWCMCVCVCVG